MSTSALQEELLSKGHSLASPEKKEYSSDSSVEESSDIKATHEGSPPPRPPFLRPGTSSYLQEQIMNATTARMPLNRSTSGVPGPPTLMRTASGRPVDPNWRQSITIQDREVVRTRIETSYRNQCLSYDDLLNTLMIIDEELLFLSTPSRLDYFKQSLQFEKRIVDKKAILAEKRKNTIESSDDDSSGSSSKGQEPDRKKTKMT